MGKKQNQKILPAKSSPKQQSAAPDKITAPAKPEKSKSTFLKAFRIFLAGIALIFGACLVYENCFKAPPLVEDPPTQITESVDGDQQIEDPVPQPAPQPTPSPNAEPTPMETPTPSPSPKPSATPTPTPAPRLKERTVVKANPASPDIKGLYGTIYCPSAGLDTNVFMGDDELTMTNGFGQQSDTFQIGYESSHLLWTSNPNYAYDMSLMNVGDRMQIETSYGTYVYKVESIDHGYRDKVDGKIYTESGHEIADIYTVDDALYLAYQHSDGKIDVVTAGIVLK